MCACWKGLSDWLYKDYSTVANGDRGNFRNEGAPSFACVALFCEGDEDGGACSTHDIKIHVSELWS
jgi:hypothetical protein